MKNFEVFFKENEIVRQLCKMRIKIAKNRNKQHLLHLLTTNSDYNYHLEKVKDNPTEFEEYQKELKEQLKEILPPRRKWVKIGQNSRIKSRNRNEFLTTNDKNFYSLLKTIKKHRKQNSKETWFLNLKSFVKEIQTSALSYNYVVEEPVVFPKLKKPLKKFFQKKEEGNKCRPLSLYSLKDRIILSQTNKFLTQVFDEQFQDSSYAFRSKKVHNKTISHHNCIRDIMDYKNSSSANSLFVVECDMKAFYDTVNHNIILDKFNQLIDKTRKKHNGLKLDHAIHIFKSFLKSYAFNVNVKNHDNPKYWSKYNIPRGQFPWVDNQLKNHYSSLKNERIGIPQGGALSGLIANIYLNDVDIRLSKSPVLYIRFCDDMIVIHEDYKTCKEAKKLYVDSLNELKLFPHKFKKTKELFEVNKGKVDYKNFWEGKSKGPFRWANSFKEYRFPWITFVGYEINFGGQIRVRKRSFLKEQTKQSIIVNEIKKAISTSQRCRKRTAIESAINRLIGMSVGRIGLDNFSEVSTDMCWKNGFQELHLNKFSKIQIKQLDRNRSALYYDLFKEVGELEEDNTPKKKRQVINYDKPFSYYYQILERENVAAKNG